MISQHTPVSLSPLLAMFAIATLPALAGNESTSMDYQSAPAESTINPLGASFFFSGGYASSYIFRGMNLGENWGEARAEVAFPLTDTTSLSIGGKYGSADSYEESQAFASIQQSFGIFTGALGYRWYGLDASERQEIGVLLGTKLIGIDWSLGYYYDVGISAQYAELNGQYSWQLLDALALRTSAGISVSSDYWSNGSGFNNAVFRIDLPVTLRQWCTLTPWVAASIPLDTLDNLTDDEVFGGVTLLLSF